MKDFSQLTDEQLNMKIAKRIGWKFANDKWWHDQHGDGPLPDYVNGECGGREVAIKWLNDVKK